MNRRRWLLVAAVLAIVLLAILGANLRPGAGSTGQGSPPATGVATTPEATRGGTALPTRSPRPLRSASAGSLADLLAMLNVGPEDRTGYDRSLFVLWIDRDGDGCNTRREVLIAEAVVAPKVGGGCDLTGGRWHSIYDGVGTSDPALFDVDHVVPLAEAWDSGASGWTPERRTAFANDLGVEWSLVAVSAASNRSKSDGDPADWLPPLVDVQCRYAADWLAIKVRWSLSIDPFEQAMLASFANKCLETRLVVPAP